MCVVVAVIPLPTGVEIEDRGMGASVVANNTSMLPRSH